MKYYNSLHFLFIASKYLAPWILRSFRLKHLKLVPVMLSRPSHICSPHGDIKELQKKCKALNNCNKDFTPWFIDDY